MSLLEYMLLERQMAEPPKLTIFDYTTRLIVPVLSIVGAVVLALYGKQRGVLWALLGVAVVSLLLGFSERIASVITSSREEREDRRIAARYLPELRKLSNRFADFVHSSRQETLHYIVDNFLCDGQAQKIALLRLPPIFIWSGWCQHFAARLAQNKNPNLNDLREGAEEFRDLIGSYIAACAWPVYGLMPKELSDAMQSNAKVELAAFQQRIERYIFDAEELLKEIGCSRECLNHLPNCFMQIKPLP